MKLIKDSCQGRHRSGRYLSLTHCLTSWLHSWLRGPSHLNEILQMEERKGRVNWKGSKEGKGKEIEDAMRGKKWGMSSLLSVPVSSSVILEQHLLQLWISTYTLSFHLLGFHFAGPQGHAKVDMLSRSTKFVTPLHFPNYCLSWWPI